MAGAARWESLARWPARLLILALLVLAGYGGILGAYFLADDFLLIHTVLDGQDRADWSVVLQHLYSTQYIETFRPMVTFLHTLGYAIWGVQPTGYHALNLLIHLGNAALLAALLARLIRPSSLLIPLLGAAVFATHPVHPEAVTYIGSLPILACTMFYLLALGCAVRRAAGGRWPWAILGPGCFVLALGSKEEAISLPLVVGLVALLVRGEDTTRRRLVASAGVSLPYWMVLVLYLGYRLWLFGAITPIYYREVHGAPLQFLRGAAWSVARLISPINVEYLGAWGWPTFFGVLLVMGPLLVVLALRRWASPTSLAFCGLAFLAFLVPINKTLLLDVDPGLTNSRFLYLPSLAFAAAVALVVGGEAHRPRRAWVPMVAIGVVAIQLSQLIVNNSAWAEAASLMRAMQRESRRLTGNQMHIEVINVPDTIHGVLFDRGGFRHSLLSPFVPDNAMHRRERLLLMPSSAQEPVTIHTVFPERFALDARIEGGETGGATIRVVFRPEEAKLYRGQLVLRHPRCPPAVVSVQGQGTVVSPLPTYLAALIRPAAPSPERADAFTYMASVADVADGIAAEEVSVWLLPDVPWRLRYFPLTTDGRPGAPNTPVRIPDGSFRHFLLEVTPTAPSRAGLLAPRVGALNAPVVMPSASHTVVELPDALPAFGSAATDATPPPPPHQCPALAQIPSALDFGVVPISPQPLRQSRPFGYYGQEPAHLFWDSLRQRLLPMSAVERAPVLLHVAGGNLSSWDRSSGLSYLRISHAIGAVHAPTPGHFLATSRVDIPATEAAYALIRMRIAGQSYPYARLVWRSTSHEAERAALVVVVPDGYWHTYGIPLHALTAWQSAGRIRYLRLDPAPAGGWAEIEFLDILGPIPDRDPPRVCWGTREAEKRDQLRSPRLQSHPESVKFGL